MLKGHGVWFMVSVSWCVSGSPPHGLRAVLRCMVSERLIRCTCSFINVLGVGFGLFAEVDVERLRRCMHVAMSLCLIGTVFDSDGV